MKSLLPEGQDIAQVALARGNSSAEEIEELAKSNYIYSDINKDGIKDVLVIGEEDGVYRNYNNDQLCQEGSEDCMFIFGERTLHYFQGKADGSFTHKFSNADVVRNGDEGGMMGDPLGGLELKSNGAIVLSHSGGSAWKWNFSDTFQFRNGDIFVIGQDSGQNGPDLSGSTKSINLITGQVVEQTFKEENEPGRTKRYRIKVKPLVRLASYKGQDV